MSQLAGRYDSYNNDIGSTFNPKLGINWAPHDRVTLRASWGTSFKAPTSYQTTQSFSYHRYRFRYRYGYGYGHGRDGR